MGLKQPLTGVVATALMIALALFYISRFDLAGFTGWGAYAIMGLIPVQVMAGILWGGKVSLLPGTAQPWRGLGALAVVVVLGGIFSWLCWTIYGGNASPPAPNAVFFVIVAVVVTFWWCIIWGGWPFTKLIPNSTVAGLAVIAWVFVLNAILFKIFFNFEFLKGAPVYNATLDPGGMFDAWHAQVFYVTALAIMFLLLHFDLWPLTTQPSLMAQPTLGVVFTVICLVGGGIAKYVGVTVLGIDVVHFLVTVPIPFIFGTIVLLNMMEGHFFKTMAQPAKGVVSAAAAAVLGTALSQLYLALVPMVTGVVKAGPPTYDLEIWLASALLAVTFPMLVAYAVYLEFWPLKKSS
jgi:hypothetical protein